MVICKKCKEPLQMNWNTKKLECGCDYKKIKKKLKKL